MRHRPKPPTTSWAVTVDPFDLFRVPPSRFKDPLCDTPQGQAVIDRARRLATDPELEQNHGRI
jgi:hypothetical protein